MAREEAECEREDRFSLKYVLPEADFNSGTITERNAAHKNGSQKPCG